MAMREVVKNGITQLMTCQVAFGEHALEPSRVIDRRTRLHSCAATRKKLCREPGTQRDDDIRFRGKGSSRRRAWLSCAAGTSLHTVHSVVVLLVSMPDHCQAQTAIVLSLMTVGKGCHETGGSECYQQGGGYQCSSAGTDGPCPNQKAKDTEKHGRGIHQAAQPYDCNEKTGRSSI